jgi:hypothetical protein
MNPQQVSQIKGPTLPHSCLVGRQHIFSSVRGFGIK